MGDALYIADPGIRKGTPQESPARIIQVPLVDGKPAKPSVFFERKDFLISAKWIAPAGGHHSAVNALVVADEGRQVPLDVCKTLPKCVGGFTGEGAKVFLLPILHEGRAGEPKILWQDEPLFCPTGIAVAGQFAYVTDPCAGPIRTRPEKPDEPFTSSAFFTIPITGGKPVLLWEGFPFTTLIGVCDVEHQGKHSLIVHDIHSGRLDPQGFSFPGFAPPGGAELWVFDILDIRAPKVSAPSKVPFTEEGPVTLQFDGITDPDKLSIVVTILNGNTFPDLTTQRVIPAKNLTQQGLNITIASPVELEKVSFHVEVVDNIAKRRLRQALFTLRKDLNQTPQFLDNKHRGKVEKTDTGEFFHFTIDEARDGNAAVWVFPPEGGTPVALAKGSPLVRPISAQVSPDQKTLWITDQSGALFALKVPDFDTLKNLFPRR